MKRIPWPVWSALLGVVLGLVATWCLTGCSDALAVEQAPATFAPVSQGSVYSGVGAPRSYDPITVATTGSTELGDGTNPLLIPWNGVVNCSCPSLIGTANVVLACFSMNVAATVDISDGQINDGTRDGQGHCRWIDGARPAVDMRLDRRRLIEGWTLHPGALGTIATLGACNRAGTNFHLAPCLVSSESTDCGAASTCDTGLWSSSQNIDAITMIAGAWVQFDGTASTACNCDSDI